MDSLYRELFEISFEAQCIINLKDDKAHINCKMAALLNIPAGPAGSPQIVSATDVLDEHNYNIIKTHATEIPSYNKLTIAGQKICCYISRRQHFLLCSCSTSEAYNEIKNLGIRHVCHEIRNCLDAGQKEALALTDQLFTLSCINNKSGHMLRPGQYRLVSILTEVIRALPPHPKIILKHVKNMTLYIDKVRLQIILRNLLTNAIRYGKGMDIVLKTCMVGASELEISVIDQGDGLSPEQGAALFQYCRNPAAVTGNGIGLALCKELASAMGLNIYVKKPAGQGSEFVIHIPSSIIIRPEMAEQAKLHGLSSWSSAELSQLACVYP